ncbi:thioredoxin domain-containing protein [Piscinibacter sakaiensis]|uniref:thioredoxin domain-containing protein n=1 Tax=Piscinibacter sakaiensis TaxID=1547922 RepID=UPI003AAC3B05
MNPPPSAAPTAPLLVACLCARWCGLCGEYRATFDAAKAAHAGRAEFFWVDIEDDEELLGPVDVDDFPTLLVADRDGPVFYGPLTPQPAKLTRLLQSALAGDLRPLADNDIIALTERLRATGSAAAG